MLAMANSLTFIFFCCCKFLEFTLNNFVDNHYSTRTFVMSVCSMNTSIVKEYESIFLGLSKCRTYMYRLESLKNSNGAQI